MTPSTEDKPLALGSCKYIGGLVIVGASIFVFQAPSIHI